MSQEEIPFAGRLTEKEYRAVLRAARPGFLKLLPWLMLVVLAVAWWVARTGPAHGGVREDLPRIAIGLLLVLVLAVGPEMAIRSTWKKNALAQEPVSGAVTPKGIRWEGASAKAFFAWDGLRGVRSRKDLLLLYTPADQAFWLLPRFFESREDWERARERIVGSLRRR